MKALRFNKTGSLDALAIQEVPMPVVGPDELLIEIKAAAVNPSDVANVLGKMHGTTVPRTPGRDFAGIVREGSSSLEGTNVFGSGGNLGIGRDGSHAEFLAVPASAVRPMPSRLTFEQAASIGVAYLTAWTAVVSVARLQPGETILITGTTGAVGGAAARIAKRLGARVLGTVRTDADLQRVKEPAVSAWISLEAGPLPEAVRAATAGRGADAVLDVVGGALFEPCLASLAQRGRQVAIASNPDSRVSFDLRDFYHREGRLFGVDSLQISFEEAGNILEGIIPGIESGEYPPPVVETSPLSEGPKVYRALAAHTIKGKPVLTS